MKNVNEKLRFSIILLTAIFLFDSCNAQEKNLKQTKIEKGNEMLDKKTKAEDDWKNELTPEQYHVLREKGTERPFSGKYWNFVEDGSYRCAACGAVLFDSKTKFDAGCGWPSFSDVVNNKNILTKEDNSLGMQRVEVMCANCGGHLGHVFDDGPNPTGLRYCINSASIEFEKREKEKK